MYNPLYDALSSCLRFEFPYLYQNQSVFFENVHAINAQTCIKVTGIEESTIDNFQFKNVSFEGDNAGNISYAKNWKFTDFKVRGAKENKLKLSNNKDVRIKD